MPTTLQADDTANLKAAKSFDLNLPQSLLARADEVIEKGRQLLLRAQAADPPRPVIGGFGAWVTTEAMVAEEPEQDPAGDATGRWDEWHGLLSRLSLLREATPRAGVRLAWQIFWGGTPATAFWTDPGEELTVVFMTQVIGNGARLTPRRDLRTLVSAAMTGRSGRPRENLQA